MAEIETQDLEATQDEVAAIFADAVGYEPCDDTSFHANFAGWEAHLRAA